MQVEIKKIVIEQSWKNKLFDEFNSEYFLKLKEFLVLEKKRYKIFPQGKCIFNAFNLTPFDQVKVVILGQDPYHGIGQSHGLCFSVPQGVTIPPSLVNIYKEIEISLGIKMHNNGNLEKWASQGVLLLNATLTVRANHAGSHQNKGWEIFTDAVIKKISEEKENVVFMLWGNYAHAKEKIIDTNKHLILKAPHPSPLSAHRGFIGCNHFLITNQFLTKIGKEPINWQL